MELEQAHVEEMQDLGFQELEPSGDVLKDIPITVSIELAQMQLTIAQIGAFKDGEVLELNKGPGELVDLLVSGRLIAKGELVDVDGELGVRIRSLVK